MGLWLGRRLFRHNLHQKSRPFFSEILNDKMNLAPVGIIADVFWHEIINHAKNIGLGAFVVMPNHIHGILILDGNDRNVDGDTNDGNGNGNVETRHALSLQPTQQSSQTPRLPGQRRFQNQGKNTISSILGGYKSALTKHANRMGYDFGWQTRFHDHIIRDEASFARITEYILNNPKNWKEDRFFE